MQSDFYAPQINVSAAIGNTSELRSRVWKSKWTSWAPVPNKPTVSVDVKQHFNQQGTQSQRQCSRKQLLNTKKLTRQLDSPSSYAGEPVDTLLVSTAHSPSRGVAEVKPKIVWLKPLTYIHVIPRLNKACVATRSLVTKHKKLWG